jgi:membrane-associated phospholipid phosphatase
MKALIKTPLPSSGYILLYSLFAIFNSLYCLILPKRDGFLLINHFHCSLSDSFFTLVTCLGNGIFILVTIILLLIFKKPGWSFQIIVSFIVSGLVVQILKHLIHSPRPKLFFPYQAIHCISGVTCSGYTSFPSGHTTTIFAFTTLLSFYFPDKRWGVLLFLIAALTGFSRIYLSDHFPIDVLVGSFLGVFISILTYLFIPLDEFDKKLRRAIFGNHSVNLQ